MNNKKRVLMIGSLPPPVHGSAMMMQYIKDSKIINEEFDCDYINISTSRSMSEIGNKPFLKILRSIRLYVKTFTYLVFRHYDLCYLQTTCRGKGFLKDMPCLVMARLFCKNRVIHQHNKGMANCIDKWPYNMLIPLCYHGAKVILLSWKLYPDVQKVVKKEDIIICPNGIPSNSDFEVEISKNKDTPHILYLSNLMIEKGILVLFDSLQVLKKKNIRFFCDFVGGESKNFTADRFIKEAEERGIQDCVLYHGSKYGKDKETYWNHADVFVLPSLDECMSMVNIEAMQHRLPVVCTDVGASTDVVRQGVNGYTCKPNDFLQLEVLLEKLVINPELRRELGNNGYDIYEKEYTVSVYEQTLLTELSKLLA